MKTKQTKKEVTKQILAIDNVTDLIKYCKTIGLNRNNWGDIYYYTYKYSHSHISEIVHQFHIIKSKRYTAQCNKSDKLLIYKKIYDNINELKTNYTNYSKVLTIGNTNIYMCHPYYKHRDYNKYVLCPKNAIDSKIISLAQDIENKIINQYKIGD